MMSVDAINILLTVLSVGANTATILDSHIARISGSKISRALRHDAEHKQLRTAIERAYSSFQNKYSNLATVITMDVVSRAASELANRSVRCSDLSEAADDLALVWATYVSGPAADCYKDEFAQAALDFLITLHQELRLCDAYRPLLTAFDVAEIRSSASETANNTQKIGETAEAIKETLGKLLALANKRPDSLTFTDLPKNLVLAAGGPPFQEWKLPISTPAFVGRTEEATWLSQRLRAKDARKATVIRGIGGIGKSALAAKVIQRMRVEDRFQDGIIVLDCGEVVDARAVLLHIASSFGFQHREQGELDIEQVSEIVHDLLVRRDALVVLDDVQGELALSRVLRPFAGALAHLLVTSRVLVEGVPSEDVLELRELPPPRTEELFARCLGYGSLDALDAQKRDRIGKIAASLYFHTLAVRLAGLYAAACHRDLTELIQELNEDPLAIPDGNQERTVALVLAKSLTSIERAHPLAGELFAALSAFASPNFGRRAAKKLANGIGLTQSGRTIDLMVRYGLLGSYCDTGMPEGSDRERLHLHPLLHALAAEQFESWQQEKRERAFHALCAFYGEYVPLVDGDESERLDRDAANIERTLEYAHGLGEEMSILKLCMSMIPHWMLYWRTAVLLRNLPWGIEAAKVMSAKSKDQDRQDFDLVLARLYEWEGRLRERIGGTEPRGRLVQPHARVGAGVGSSGCYRRG